MDGNLNLVDYGEGNEAERTYTGRQYYRYGLYNIPSYLNWSCWLASRWVEIASSDCRFYVGVAVIEDENHASLDQCDFLDVFADGDVNYNSEYDYTVLPVVTLKSGIHMEKVSGTWQLTE